MLSALALLLACSSEPPLGSGHYTIADDGATVHQAVGQTLEVALPPGQARPFTRGELLFYLGPELGAADGLEHHRWRVDSPGTARVIAGDFQLVVVARGE
ncbi:MAG: hypothetical protein H6740_15785 [Alphaproteobacteria bacterium]|nr:hypothetical protein [Alphaproteobacteria bacterium]